MLRDHGVHDADERLVAVEEAVPPGEEIALQPALTQMLGQGRIHHPPIVGEAGICLRVDLVGPAAAAGLEHLLQAIGGRLVRPEDAEVPPGQVPGHQVPHIAAQNGHVLRLHRTGLGHLLGVLPKVGDA